MSGGKRATLRKGLLGCVAGLLVFAATAAVVLVIAVTVPDPAGLLLSVIASSIPAAFYAGVILRLDRYESEPTRVVAACFAWGAIGAILLSIIASLIFEDVVADLIGPEFAPGLTIVFGAPLIEETAKGIALLAVLLIARDEFDSTLDGLVYGALVGAGFAMTENILYFGQTYLEGGLGPFGTLVVARAVFGGLAHPAYTAVTGAALGWARSQYGRGWRRFVVPVLGWAGAVALHMAWNGGLTLTENWLGDPGILELVAVQAMIVLVPAVLVLYVVARLSHRHELEILRRELRPEVEQGTISESEYRLITDDARRKETLAIAKSRGGRALRGQQLAFFHTAGDLAFRRHHRQRGDADKPVYGERDAQDRKRLFDLRYELVHGGMPFPER
ncbi:MAG: PrsW family intramembrane metalloprotease [Chloroflexota bacterium]|nr:PrsW family intramembrane metalloprotease [Chloroflexota bacterium]